MRRAVSACSKTPVRSSLIVYYESWACEGGRWRAGQEPRVELGEAFWVCCSPNEYVWKRIFLSLETLTGADVCLPVLGIKCTHAPSVALTISGEPGAVYRIEGSLDLVEWISLATVTNEVGQLAWTDPDFSLHPYRFYRVSEVRP